MLIAPMYAGFRRLHRIVLVVDRRRRARKIVDFVDLDIERKRDVMSHQFEARIIRQMRDVRFCAGEEIVHAQYVMSGR